MFVWHVWLRFIAHKQADWKGFTSLLIWIIWKEVGFQHPQKQLWHSHVRLLEGHVQQVRSDQGEEQARGLFQAAGNLQMTYSYSDQTFLFFTPNHGFSFVPAVPLLFTALQSPAFFSGIGISSSFEICEIMKTLKQSVMFFFFCLSTFLLKSHAAFFGREWCCKLSLSETHTHTDMHTHAELYTKEKWVNDTWIEVILLIYRLPQPFLPLQGSYLRLVCFLQCPVYSLFSLSI